MPRDSHGNEVFGQALRAGSKVQVISQNFCDKHTWYSTSARRTAQAMTSYLGLGLVWSLAASKVGVDVNHGRIPHERRLHAAHSPVVKIDGVTKTEVDPHTNVGDYTVDYATMTVTTTDAHVGATVTLDFSEVVNSKWHLKPDDGKLLRLVSAELQFSADARMDDSFIFQPRGDVAKFAALAQYWDANGGPYPAGTMLPLDEPTVYQTVFDLICEANLAYPPIPSFAHATPTWRDTTCEIYIFSWDYGKQAVIDITSGPSAEDPGDIEISLEHDVEMAGKHAVVTFYCTPEDL